MRQPEDPIFINRDFRVVAEDPGWIVVDKPPHLLVHPTAPNGPFTLWDGLRELLAFELANGGQISLINRLDRETSGLILVAKNAATARIFATAMQSGWIKKEYLLIVLGHPKWETATASMPLRRKGEVEHSAIYLKQMAHPDGSAAETVFSVLQRFRDFDGVPLTLLRATPKAGRTHQIRVHAAELGFPLLGDKIYGTDERCYLDFIDTGWSTDLAVRLLHPRHALHSAKLSLPHLKLEWSSLLPCDLQEVVDRGTCSQPVLRR